MTVVDLFDWIQKGGVVMLLLLIVVAFVKGYVVPVWIFNLVLREREEYRKEAWEGAKATEDAAAVTEHIVRTVRPAGEP